jgi:membrane protein implicated in regulation of membrane protease activity
MFILTASAITDVIRDSPLNLIFAAALFAGVIYAFFLMFFHGIGDALGDLGVDLHMDMAHDVHIDTHDASEAAGVSTLAIASFVASFGAFGLLAVTLLDAGTIVSLFAALAGGIVFGIAAQFFFLYILSPTISSEVQQARLIGQVAEIITPIPANGVGQIAFVAQGGRVTYSARVTEGQESVERGTPVRIERIVGGTVYVSRID